MIAHWLWYCEFLVLQPEYALHHQAELPLLKVKLFAAVPVPVVPVPVVPVPVPVLVLVTATGVV